MIKPTYFTHLKALFLITAFFLPQSIQAEGVWRPQPRAQNPSWSSCGSGGCGGQVLSAPVTGCSGAGCGGSVAFPSHGSVSPSYSYPSSPSYSSSPSPQVQNSVSPVVSGAPSNTFSQTPQAQAASQHSYGGENGEFDNVLLGPRDNKVEGQSEKSLSVRVTGEKEGQTLFKQVSFTEEGLACVKDEDAKKEEGNEDSESSELEKVAESNTGESSEATDDETVAEEDSSETSEVASIDEKSEEVTEEKPNEEEGEKVAQCPEGMRPLDGENEKEAESLKDLEETLATLGDEEGKFLSEEEKKNANKFIESQKKIRAEVAKKEALARVNIADAAKRTSEVVRSVGSDLSEAAQKMFAQVEDGAEQRDKTLKLQAIQKDIEELTSKDLKQAQDNLAAQIKRRENPALDSSQISDREYQEMIAEAQQGVRKIQDQIGQKNKEIGGILGLESIDRDLSPEALNRDLEESNKVLADAQAQRLWNMGEGAFDMARALGKGALEVSQATSESFKKLDTFLASTNTGEDLSVEQRQEIASKAFVNPGLAQAIDEIEQIPGAKVDWKGFAEALLLTEPKSPPESLAQNGAGSSLPEGLDGLVNSHPTVTIPFRTKKSSNQVEALPAAVDKGPSHPSTYTYSVEKGEDGQINLEITKRTCIGQQCIPEVVHRTPVENAEGPIKVASTPKVSQGQPTSSRTTTQTGSQSTAGHQPPGAATSRHGALSTSSTPTPDHGGNLGGFLSKGQWVTIPNEGLIIHTLPPWTDQDGKEKKCKGCVVVSDLISRLGANPQYKFQELRQGEVYPQATFKDADGGLRNIDYLVLRNALQNRLWELTSK